MDCKPLHESTLPCYWWDPTEHISVKFELKYIDLHTRKSIWKCRLHNRGHFASASMYSTHLPLVSHICVSGWVIIGKGNGLSPFRRQAITWTNAGLLLIALMGTNLSEIWIGILSFSFKKMHSKMSSAKMATILSRERGVKPAVSWHTNYMISGGHIMWEHIKTRVKWYFY